MTEFENKINEGKLSPNCINATIFDLNSSETFNAWINAETLQEIDSKLLQEYEMDKLATLSKYFDPVKVERWQIELLNSQFIYFHSFKSLYNRGFHRYVEALEKNRIDIMNMFDRKYQK